MSGGVHSEAVFTDRSSTERRPSADCLANGFVRRLASASPTEVASPSGKTVEATIRSEWSAIRGEPRVTTAGLADHSYLILAFTFPPLGGETSVDKGNRVSCVGDTRCITIGEQQSSQKYPANLVRTSKYTIWSFLPCNLLEQFRRVANLYFLATTIIVVTIDTPVNPLTSLLPLVFVVTVTAVKQGYEDILRHKGDQKENMAAVTVIRNGVCYDTESRHVLVGDVVLVRSGQEVPCDMVLVASSTGTGRCTVTTANLDGETNLKTLAVPDPLRYVRYPDQLLALRGIIECEQPNSDLYRFYGRIELKSGVDRKTAVHAATGRCSETSAASATVCACDRENVIAAIPSVIPFACSPTPSATESAIAVVGAFEDSPATTPTIDDEAATPSGSVDECDDRLQQALRPLLWRCLPVLLRGESPSNGAKKSLMSPSPLPIPTIDTPDGSEGNRVSFSKWAASQDPLSKRASSPNPPVSIQHEIILPNGRPHSVPDRVMPPSYRALEKEPSLAIVGPAPASRPSSLVTEEAAQGTSRTTLTPSVVGPLVEESEDDSMTAALSVDNLLLKGSRLHTEYVYGCAVYTGPHTKLALNSHFTRTKFSTLEKSINIYLFFQILLLMALVITCTVGRHYKTEQSDMVSELRDVGLNILRYLVLFNYLLPISLYVTIELIKFLGALFFSWDLDMYHGRKAVCNSSDLNEELGQVQYLFTDKTGTLTENQMEFKRCCINGIVYADVGNRLMELTSEGDETQGIPADMSLATIRHFFLALALCHTCRIAFDRESPEKDLEYTSCGPDERSLLQAAARRGVVYLGEDSGCYIIRNNRKIFAYRVLDVLEFTSERRRMSVIVRDPSGTVWLFCKGAHSSIIPLVEHGRVRSISQRVRDFALRGFRTMVVACRRLTDGDLHNARRRLREARHNMTSTRATVVEEAYRVVESGLTVMGATAVEDKLQPLVQETLEALKAAFVKIWVLTGDQVETAVNIAYACGHFKMGTDLLFLTEHTTPGVVESVLKCHTAKVTKGGNYGLVIDGTSLALALKHCPQLLSDVGGHCQAVVCCRLSPLQKCEVVRLVKSRKEHPTTAAIGDGANDVSMIQEAHVGIGIMGHEGRQAESSSDFAIGRFHFCRKAFLVHGHWYYHRLCLVIHYFFYKNIVFVMPQFFYVVTSNFSLRSMYDSMFLTTYNIIFTSLPIIFVGLLEQKWPPNVLQRKPQHYSKIRNNILMTVPYILLWTLQGFWHSATIFFGSSAILMGTVVEPLAYDDELNACYLGVASFTIAVIIVNLKLLLESRYITAFLMGAVLGSIFIGYAIAVLYYYVVGTATASIMFRAYVSFLSSPVYWLMVIIIVFIAMIPDTTIIVILNTLDMDVERRVPWWWPKLKRRRNSVRTTPRAWVRFIKRPQQQEPSIEGTL